MQNPPPRYVVADSLPGTQNGIGTRQAALQAQRDVVPATRHLTSAEVAHLSFNRRLAHRDGSTHMDWESLEADEILGARGPIDPELLVMVFSDEGGAAIGALVHFTLHPAVLVGHDGWCPLNTWPR